MGTTRLDNILNKDRWLFAALNVAVYLCYPRLILRYRRKIGQFPNVACPGSYAQRMLWRKVFDHNPHFTLLADKLASRDHWQQRAPRLPLPPVLWVADSAEDAVSRLDAVPVVVKASHGSDMNWIWQGNPDEGAKLLRAMRGWLGHDFGKKNHEWAYFDVPRRLFAEVLLKPVGEHGLVDLNVRCADGVAIMCSVILRNKKENMAYDYYNMAGEWLDLGDPPHPQMPALSAMLPMTVWANAVDCAVRASRGIDFARYDFLYDGRTLYGGEITIYPKSGWSRPSAGGEFEQILEQSWDLRKCWFLQTAHTGWRQTYARALRRWLEGLRA